MSDNKSEEKIKFLRNLVNSAKEKLADLEAESRNLAEQNKQLLLQNIFLLEKLEEQERILAVFGPEGGFSEKEFDYFKSKNIKLTTLGNLILKAPNAITAGLFGIITNYDNKR